MGVQFLDALKFVSIADEKVARVFEAPRAFVQLSKNLQVIGVDVDEVGPLFPCTTCNLSRSLGYEAGRSNRSSVGFIQQGRQWGHRGTAFDDYHPSAIRG